MADVARLAARAEADRSLAAGRREAARLAVTRFQDEASDAARRLEDALAGAEDLDDPAAARTAVEAARLSVESARVVLLTRRSAQDDRRRDGEARMRRKAEALRELDGWQTRAQTARLRSADLALRQTETEAELAEAEAAPEDIAARREDLTDAIAGAEEKRRLAIEALAEADAAVRKTALAERDAERAAGDAREARARAEARTDAARDALTQAAGRIAEETGATPAQLLHTLKADVDKMPPIDQIDADVTRLRRQREALGAVNLLAEADARKIEAEYDTLAAEKLDLEQAIAKLRLGIASLNREGRERLLTAFEQVNANFATLFTHLFGGGEARLVLVESDDPLEAGLEIMCQPPGKRLAVLSLLSGGEQTLTALALIFGVFLANPAPICVLDEVDAPLDDANVTRFCDLLDEMARRTDTRFLVITHHAVTMARMDRLFGVTMAEQGVSQLVSVDLRKAAALVA
jgi:chromosome segregation protein